MTSTRHRSWCATDQCLANLHSSAPRVVRQPVSGSRVEVFVFDSDTYPASGRPGLVLEIYLPAYDGEPADADTEPMATVALRPAGARELAAHLVDLADIAEGVAR